MSISSASELESSSLINFARSLHFTDRERIKEREDGKRSCRGGGGDYSREAIILNISDKGGRLFEGGD